MAQLHSNAPAAEDDSGGSSPFDRARRWDGAGEWWSARALAPLLGYADWTRFEDTLSRARAAIAACGHPACLHVARCAEGLPGGPVPRIDYQLTRYGAYMAVASADPRKPEVAAAQSHFARLLRSTESLPAGPPPPPRADEDALAELLTDIRRGRVVRQPGR